MSDSDRLLEERNSLLKWHFEEGYKRVKATAAETARKLARFVALERYLNGQSRAIPMPEGPKSARQSILGQRRRNGFNPSQGQKRANGRPSP